MKKKMIALALACMAAGSVVADEAYLGVGTTGYGLGYGMKLSEDTGLRVELDALNYSRSFSSDSINYNANIKLNSATVFYDYHPFSNTFLISAGLVFGGNKITGTATGTGGTYTINGVNYNAAGESLTFTAKEPVVQPYIGIGVGHKQASTGFGFFADLGVQYGKPKVTLSASPGLAAAAGQNNINAEQSKLQGDVDKFEWYPVVKLGVTYTF